MTRRVPEWIGSHPDQKIPQRVRLRVFERFNGVCQISKRKIQVGEAWEIDHKLSLKNGGEHRESNFRPVLKTFHKKKSAQDQKDKADTYRKRSKHLGIHQPKRKIPGSKGTPYKVRLTSHGREVVKR
ncbi:MAG: HNH endonuclease [Pseudomonadota bacterium]